MVSFQIGVRGHFLLKLCPINKIPPVYSNSPDLEGDFILLCHRENVRGHVGEAPFQGDRGTWVRGSTARPGVKQVPKGRFPLSAGHGGRAGWQAELQRHQKPAAGP